MNNKFLDFIGAHISIKKGIDVAVQDAISIGANAMQIFTYSPERWGIGKKALSFNDKLLEEKEFVIVSHSSYLINLASEDESIRKKSLLAIESEILRCIDLNIRYIVVHGGSRKHFNRENAIKILVDNLRYLYEKFGELMPFLLLENTVPSKNRTKILDSLEDFIDVFSYNLQRVGICLDINHLFATGIDTRNIKTMNEFLEKLTKHVGNNTIKVVHVSDSKMDFGSMKDKHESILDGYMQKESYINLMQSQYLRNTIKILETPNPDKYKSEIHFLRNIETIH